MTNHDGWTVVLHEMIMHIQNFVDNNPMEYEGKELEAYTTGLGMVSVLARQMIRDIQREKADVEV